MSVRVRVLGSGTLVLGQGRASACIVISLEEKHWVFDLGRGALLRMEEAGLDPYQVTSLQFTHWHPDHTCDLVPFLFARNYTPGRAEPLSITGPVGFAQFFEDLQVPWRWLAPRFECEVREVTDEPWEAGGAQLTPVPMSHGDMPAVGYRWRGGGRSVAFTGDTGPGEHLLSLARGVDILVSECSWPDDAATPTHLSPTELGRAAQEAGCQRLVITHRYPELSAGVALEALGREFKGKIVLAEDGWTAEV